MPTPLEQQLIQICPFKVKLFTRLSEGVLEPVCNDGMCIAMTTPFNRQKLETLTMLNIEGEGVVAGINCRMDLPIYHGPNIRFSLCMDGAASIRPDSVAEPDKLQTQTVIYANASVSLKDLMLHERQPRRVPLLLPVTSSDEKINMFVLQVTPQVSGAQYTPTNLNYVERISALHIGSDVIARALNTCQELRRQAMVEHMQSQGVNERDSSAFYMTLPVGSLYDLSSGEAKQCTVDATQWNYLVRETSAQIADTHVFKLCESMVMMLTHSVAGLGVDIRNPNAVHGFMSACHANSEGRTWLSRAAQLGMRSANESSFVYTSDSQVKGFNVVNRESGVFLEAQMDSSGEKQNLFGVDPLVSGLHIAHKCAAAVLRAQEALTVGLDNSPVELHAGLQATFQAALARAQYVEADNRFMADCEDAACSLAGVASTAARMDPDCLDTCVRKTMGSAAFSAEAGALVDSVLVSLPFLRDVLSKLQVGLCFAHAASIQDIRSKEAAMVLPGVRAKYAKLVDAVNSRMRTGHACLWEVQGAVEGIRTDGGHPQLLAPQRVHKLFVQHEITGVVACEGTNPVHVAASDSRCVLNSSSSLPMLNDQLKVINGDMPRTAANSIVSEITAKSATNVLGCSTCAVTYTTSDASFYDSMITIGGGYVYNQDLVPPHIGDPCVTLPTANIAAIKTATTRTFSIEGDLLDVVNIGARRYREADLLGMVVGAATCLAPDLDHIIDTRVRTGFVVMAGRPPLDANMTKVVVRGRMLPFSPGLTPAGHELECKARQVAALRVHPGAVAVSLSTHSWNLYVPQS